LRITFTPFSLVYSSFTLLVLLFGPFQDERVLRSSSNPPCSLLPPLPKGDIVPQLSSTFPAPPHQVLPLSSSRTPFVFHKRSIIPVFSSPPGPFHSPLPSLVHSRNQVNYQFLPVPPTHPRTIVFSPCVLSTDRPPCNLFM